MLSDRHPLRDVLTRDDRSFPPAPPSDLDDPVLIVEHDWAAFAALNAMTDHWDRPGWTQGQRHFYWLITDFGSPVLEAHAAQCQQQIEHLGMDLVPTDGMHITVVKVGSAAQMRPDVLDRLCREAWQLPVAPFPLLAHPVAGSRGAVRFTLTPWTPLVALHLTLTDVSRRVGVPGGAPSSGYRPHLGLAYNPCRRPAAPVVNAVSELRKLPPVPLQVSAVDLVELRRERSAYRWETIVTVPLAG
ncbi:2'-5' RNA ligase family protein [Streptomyces alanosinicus]|uniref:2'-5' RNA ligase family protein n=1 Tax=Streptomyces alanosinicus TaxID=68171 RepID=A0A918YPT1_9ACTN|nr:2'-5' RNA ligase family protein [Streptomyces alanosinicus]GHE11961.1 hypothetical protein GCM10010339_73560 [Streptomyces alanosinicus]